MNLGLNNIQNGSFITRAEKPDKKNIADLAEISGNSFVNQLQSMIQISVGDLDIETVNLVEQIQTKMEKSPNNSQQISQKRDDYSNQKVDNNRTSANNNNNYISDKNKNDIQNKNLKPNNSEKNEGNLEAIQNKGLKNNSKAQETNSNTSSNNSTSNTINQNRPTDSILMNGQQVELNDKSKILNSQMEIISSFSDADIKLDLALNPDVQLQKKSTKDILSQHKEFLNTIVNSDKENLTPLSKSKIELSSDEFISPDKIEGNQKEKLSVYSKSNKDYFDSLLSQLHKEKITKSDKPITELKALSSDSKTANTEKIDLGQQSNNNFGNLNSNNKSNELLKTLNAKTEINNVNNAKEFNIQSIGNKIDSKEISKVITKSKTSNIAKDTKVFENVKLKDISKIALKLSNKVNKDGNMTAQLKLNPKNLGKVTIELNLRGNQTEMSFKAENEFTAKSIEKQIGALKEKLNDNGIIANKIDVSVDSNKNENNNSGLFSQHKQSSYEDNKAKEQFIKSFSRLNSNYTEQVKSEILN